MTAPPEESMVHGSKALLRRLPSVDALLRRPDVTALIGRYGHTLVATQARALLDETRAAILRSEVMPEVGAEGPEVGTEALTRALAERCTRRIAPDMRRVLNLTGTVIHTNLGRAQLSDAVLAEACELMAAPNNLEYDLATGGRGDRDALIEPLLCELTGAQAATVVNNNAAAVLLTVAALARGREVIVSRGELVEIGGAFRMPDVMASAGAKLVEVGTTNRTHAADYQRAISADTALIFKVHPSNYAINGFTASVDEATLAPIAHAAGIALATDLGSGALIDLAAYGLPREPLPQESLAAGCDAVTFSGDKLLGGPQAGLIIGDREVVGRIRRTPLKRALRMSKLPLAVLSATLRLYLSPETLARRLPTLRLLTRPTTAIAEQARALHEPVQRTLAAWFDVEVQSMMSQIGSGSLPLERLPSSGLAMAARSKAVSVDALADALRALPLPVIGRIADDRLCLDLRCMGEPEEFLAQLPVLARLVSERAAGTRQQP